MMGSSLRCVLGSIPLVVQVFFCTDVMSAFHRGSKLSYINFKGHPFHILMSTKVDEAYVETAGRCLLRCVNNQHRFSTDIAVNPAQDGTLLCELLSSDKYNSSEKFEKSGSFHHYSIKSPCESFPCLHSGTCQPSYDTNDYSCNCTAGYTGKHCENFMPCGSEKGWKLFNGACYKHFTQKLDWNAAKKRCEQMTDESLVTLNTRKEEEFVINNVLPAQYKVWIGLYGYDGGKSRKWRWIDGSVPSFYRWGPGEPSFKSARCVFLINNSGDYINKWNDRSCSGDKGAFLCEMKQRQ